MGAGKIFVVSKRKKGRKKYKPKKWGKMYRSSKAQPMGKSLGFPRHQIVKMRYATNKALTVTTGIMATTVFAANGLHDPDLTGAGHQPYGFDQWKLFYQNFVVLGSKITVKFMNGSGAGLNAAPAVCGIYLGAGLTAYTDYETYKETGRGRQTIVPTGVDTSRTISAYYSMKKFFRGMEDPVAQYNTSSANASQDANFLVYVQTIDKLTSQVSPTVLQITIDYLVRCLDPNDLPGS